MEHDETRSERPRRWVLPLRRQLVRLAVLAAAIGTGCMIGCRPLANQLLLFPSRDPIRSSAEAHFIADPDTPDRQIECFVEEYGPAGPVRFSVLSLTGNAGRAEWTIDYTAELFRYALEEPVRYRVLAVNYAGYGRSESGADLKKLGSAARAGYRELHAKTDSGPIFVHGLSIGSTAALHLARALDGEADRPAGLLLEKAPDLWRLIVWRHGWWNLWLIALPVGWGVPISARSDLNAPEVSNIPALFVVATDDEIIPPSYVHRIASLYAGPKRAIEAKAGHNDPVQPTNTPELRASLKWLFDEAGFERR